MVWSKDLCYGFPSSEELDNTGPDTIVISSSSGNINDKSHKERIVALRRNSKNGWDVMLAEDRKRDGNENPKKVADSSRRANRPWTSPYNIHENKATSPEDVKLMITNLIPSIKFSLLWSE